MSRGPKFADRTKPRGLYSTPTFKYLLAATLTFTGILYTASHCIFSLLIEKRLEELRSKYRIIVPSADMVESMVRQKVLMLKRLAKQEDEAKRK